MRFIHQIVCFLFFFIFTIPLFAQLKVSEIDSLKKNLEKAEGKQRVDILNLLAENSINSSPEKTKEYASEALKLATLLKYEEGKSDAHHKLGVYYYYSDKYEIALQQYTNSLEIAEKLGNKKLISQALSWIGSLYRIQSDHQKAIEYYNKALSYARKINDDTRIVYCLRSIGEDYRVQQEYDRALSYFNGALVMAKQSNDQSQIAFILTAIGEVNRLQAEYINALLYLSEAILIAEDLNNNSLISNNYYSIGEIYSAQSNYPKALEYYEKSLNIAKVLNDHIRIADCYAAIGDVYNNQGEADNAIRYYDTALELSEKINYSNTRAYCLSQLGEVNKRRQKYDIALEYYNRAMKLAGIINDKHRVSHCLSMIGELYSMKLNYPRAIKNYEEGLSIARDINNGDAVTIILTQLSDVYFQQRDYKKSTHYAEEALRVSRQINTHSNIRAASEMLYKCYKANGEFHKALEMHELFKRMSDSTYSEDATKKIVQQQVRFEFNEQKAKEKLVQTKKDAEREKQLNRQRFIATSSIVGLVLMLLLAIVIYRSSRKQKFANLLLARQKQQIELQKQEITDSINYSKRIQTAILPDIAEIHEILPQSFVLYKPKDIVSGDFYYFQNLGKKTPDSTTDTILIAAADCTGHGVPGALMSVISYQKIDEAAHTLQEPKNILKRLNKHIKKTLRQTGENSNQDGLDIALVILQKNTDGSCSVKYSGANRSLLMVRKAYKQQEIEEIKPTKAAIGGFTGREQEYAQHELTFEKGDIFYMFTDGYSDQFGGDKLKKLTSKKLKEILYSIHHLPVEEQQQYLDTFIEDWKGSADQVDDILVIGVRC